MALEGENLCAACLAKPPAFDRARAILAYDENSRGAILALKHADRLDLVPGFARWLARSGQAPLAQSDMIVPVPLHRFAGSGRGATTSRRNWRGVSRATGNFPSILCSWSRSRATPSQGDMASAKARRRNVLGAFKVPDPRPGGRQARVCCWTMC